MSLDVINPTCLKKLKQLGGFTFVDPSYIDNVNFWASGLLSAESLLTGEWVSLPNPPVSIHQRGLAVYDGKLFFIHTGGSNLDITEYDIDTQQFTLLSVTGDVPSARSEFSYDMLGSDLYVYGGRLGPENYLNTLYKFDTTTHIWERLSDGSTGGVTTTGYTTRRSAGHGVIHDGIFYITGGTRANSYPDDQYGNRWMLRYDINTDTWLPAVDLYIRRMEHTSHVINNVLYLVGGSDYTGSTEIKFNDVQAYYIDTGDISHTSRTSPSEFPANLPLATPSSGSPTSEREDHAALTYNDEIYVICGENRYDRSYIDMWRFNPPTNTWYQMTSPPNSLTFGRAVVYDNEFYCSSSTTRFYKFTSESTKDFAIERFY